MLAANLELWQIFFRNVVDERIVKTYTFASASNVRYRSGGRGIQANPNPFLIVAKFLVHPCDTHYLQVDISHRYIHIAPLKMATTDHNLNSGPRLDRFRLACKWVDPGPRARHLLVSLTTCPMSGTVFPHISYILTNEDDATGSSHQVLHQLKRYMCMHVFFSHKQLQSLGLREDRNCHCQKRIDMLQTYGRRTHYVQELTTCYSLHALIRKNVKAATCIGAYDSPLRHGYCRAVSGIASRQQHDAKSHNNISMSWTVSMIGQCLMLICKGSLILGSFYVIGPSIRGGGIDIS